MKTLLHLLESSLSSGLASLIKSGGFVGEPTVKSYRVVDGQIEVSYEAKVILPPNQETIQALPPQELAALIKSTPMIAQQLPTSLVTGAIVMALPTAAKDSLRQRVAKSLSDYKSDVLIALMNGRTGFVVGDEVENFNEPNEIAKSVAAWVSGANVDFDDWGGGTSDIEFAITNGKAQFQWFFPITWEANQNLLLTINKNIDGDPYIELDKAQYPTKASVLAQFKGDSLVKENLRAESSGLWFTRVQNLKAGTSGIKRVSVMAPAYNETIALSDLTRTQLEVLFKSIAQ